MTFMDNTSACVHDCVLLGIPVSSKNDNVSISHSVNSLYVKSNSALYDF